MCGIFAYHGWRDDALVIVLEGLKQLEYRGYDSWGIAAKQQDNQEHLIIKETYSVPQPNNSHYTTPTKSAIGHTRWATHGSVTKENAHPHTSTDETIAVVHNGIIENYKELQEKYELQDIYSETDSEIIPKLIFYHLNTGKKFIDSVRETLQEVEGSFAIVVSNTKNNKLIAARKGSPLVIGIGKKEYVLSSDIPALLTHTRKIIHLEDGEIAIINDQLHIQEVDTKKEITKQVKEITWDVQTAEKEGYPHFMLKEIYEQPEKIKQAIRGRIKNEVVFLPELANTTTIKRIIIIACGTSWHAGIVGEFLLEGLAKLPVEVEYASEFRYRDPIIEPNTLVLAISQSGETADTLAALREAKKKGAKVYSICNVMDSTIARESDIVLYTRAGPEIGVASTKAFTTQVVVLYLLTAHFAKERNTLSDKKIKEMIRDVQELPKLIMDVLGTEKNIQTIAKKFSASKNALYLGRGIHYPIALEGALKLKEVSYIHAEGYPAAEMKHGPIALIDKNLPTICIAIKDSLTYEKIISNMQEVKARNGKLIIIATKGDAQVQHLSENIIFIPQSRYSLSAILAVIPLQLLAYHIAVLRGCNVDKPRNLAKSVTVE
ncbi:glutamine--fructose-6-phosphate transaminase (isomerizing) [Candidatus Woesearchaeota archaeon]|nr:glutamine--fructose-6-phosphate transaminase (isomerizing) [Candidatus Woesearchaeota archaeon]